MHCVGAGPVSEIDYHARLAWLGKAGEATGFRRGSKATRELRRQSRRLVVGNVVACRYRRPVRKGPWVLHDGRGMGAAYRTINPNLNAAGIVRRYQRPRRRGANSGDGRKMEAGPRRSVTHEPSSRATCTTTGDIAGRRPPRNDCTGIERSPTARRTRRNPDHLAEQAGNSRATTAVTAKAPRGVPRGVAHIHKDRYDGYPQPRRRRDSPGDCPS